jgi:alpha-tubulin suppressor-like RCC1 family protein
VVCWGENDVGQLLSATDAEWVATGGRTTCILSSGGELVCEGEFSTEDAGAAIVLPPQANLLDVSIGSAHVCVLTSNEEVKCWQGGFAEDAVGQAEAPEGRFIAISAGGNHTCAVAPDGNITCWGSDADGQASPPNGLKVRL